jgi:hypothetical protein
MKYINIKDILIKDRKSFIYISYKIIKLTTIPPFNSY